MTYFKLLPNELLVNESLYLNHTETLNFCKVIQKPCDDIWRLKIMYDYKIDNINRLYDDFKNFNTSEIYILLFYVKKYDFTTFYEYITSLKSNTTDIDDMNYVLYEGNVLSNTFKYNITEMLDIYMGMEYKNVIYILINAFARRIDRNTDTFSYLWDIYPQYRSILSVLSSYFDYNFIQRKDILDHKTCLTMMELWYIKHVHEDKIDRLEGMLIPLYEREQNIAKS